MPSMLTLSSREALKQYPGGSQLCFSQLIGPLECAGMHSSISAHIAKEYLLDEARDVWGPNLALFRDRLGNEGAVWPALTCQHLLPACLSNFHLNVMLTLYACYLCNVL